MTLYMMTIYDDDDDDDNKYQLICSTLKSLSFAYAAITIAGIDDRRISITYMHREYTAEEFFHDNQS